MSIHVLQRAGFLLLAVFILSAQFLAFRNEAAWPYYLLGLLVGLLGLPHGALDPLVARRLELWRTWKGLAGFLLAYGLLALGALVCWLIHAELALFLFLLYSAFHFSGDWKDGLNRWLALGCGLFIVSAPALFHPGLTGFYFEMLAGDGGSGWVLSAMRGVSLVGLAGMVSGLGAFLRSGHIYRGGELAVLFCASVVLSPLLFFLLYFCGLHSPKHLIHAVRGETWRKVLPVGVLLTSLSLLLGWGLMPLFQGARLETSLLQTVFIGLSVLTVPHMLLVERANAED